jgi:hypothetical protein
MYDAAGHRLAGMLRRSTSGHLDDGRGWSGRSDDGDGQTTVAGAARSDDGRLSVRRRSALSRSVVARVP